MRPLLGMKYDDGVLCHRAEKALAEDPLVHAELVEVTSKNGVVQLRGMVRSAIEKRHAVEAVRRALDAAAGLKYARIDDRIFLG